MVEKKITLLQAPENCPWRYWIKNDGSCGTIDKLEDSKPRCVGLQLKKICRPGQVKSLNCPATEHIIFETKERR